MSCSLRSPSGGPRPPATEPLRPRAGRCASGEPIVALRVQEGRRAAFTTNFCCRAAENWLCHKPTRCCHVAKTKTRAALLQMCLRCCFLLALPLGSTTHAHHFFCLAEFRDPFSRRCDPFSHHHLFRALRATDRFLFAADCSGYSQHVHGARSLTLRTRHPSPDHSLYPYPHTDHLCPIFYPCRYPTALRIDQPLASRLELAGAGCRACRAAKPRDGKLEAGRAPGRAKEEIEARLEKARRRATRTIGRHVAARKSREDVLARRPPTPPRLPSPLRKMGEEHGGDLEASPDCVRSIFPVDCI